MLTLAMAFIGQADEAKPVVVVTPEAEWVMPTAPEPVAYPVAAVITTVEVARAIEQEAAEQAAKELLDQAVEFIEPFEGRSYRVYRDSLGYRTIAVGFNLDRTGAAEDIESLLPGVSYRALRRGDVPLTDAQIDTLLRHDTQRAIDTARRQVTGFDTLPRVAQMIIIDMTFNTGSLHKWRKLRAALARQDFASAADEMHDSRWRKQTGQRARRHIQMMHTISNG